MRDRFMLEENNMSVFSDQGAFMLASDQTVGLLNKPQFDMYRRLIDEEVEELNDAISSNDRVEQLDALLDIIVVTIGAMHSLGVNAQDAWDEVISSNMSKIDSDTGKVLKREDGKVLKPIGFRPPELAKFVL